MMDVPEAFAHGGSEFAKIVDPHASMGPDGRLTNLSDDNHQPWLWFTHIFCLIFVASAVALRAYIKRSRYGKEDTVLLVGHVFYIANWALLVVAILRGLGKAPELVEDGDEAQVSKFVFASRVLLCIVLCLVKVSNALLVLEIFTKSMNGMMLWFYIIVGATLAQALIGPLILSAGCSPTQVLAADPHALCSSNGSRWIAFTTLETLLEIGLVIPVLAGVMSLHSSLKTRMFAAAAFLCRLIVWIPAWIHLSLYIKFMESDRPNIGIVPTIIAEVLWAAIALASASVPVLMKVAKRFTTPGMLVGEEINMSARPSRSRTKSTPNHSANSGTTHSHGTNTTTARRWSNGRELSPATQLASLRPDVEEDQAYTTSVLPGRRKSKSFNSSAESQVGILREVQFEVSSHRVPSTSSLEK